MIRLILGIILTPLFWGALMFPGNQLVYMIFPQELSGASPSIAFLLTAIGASLIYSVFSGFCAAFVAGTNVLKLALGSSLALLIFGIVAQLQYWNQLPLWYHLCFLGLLVPANIVGTRLYKNKATA